jgi:regulator of nonsense transcripts 2
MYVLSKNKPPMDVDFMITDTLELLRPQLNIISSYEEANEAVDRMLLEQLKTVQGADGKLQEDGFEESEASDSSSDEDEDDALLNEDDDENNNNSDSNININNDGDEEDDVVVLKNKKDEQLSREDEEDFEREFSKMMSDSIESRKFEKKAAMLDVPIPMNLRGSQGKLKIYKKKNVI